MKTTKVYIRDCTPVQPQALLLFGGKLEVYHAAGVITIDNWLEFLASPKTAVLVKHLRRALDDLLRAKVCQPASQPASRPASQQRPRGRAGARRAGSLQRWRLGCALPHRL